MVGKERDHFDDALDDIIRHAHIIARSGAQDRAKDDAHRHADQANGHRDLPAHQDAGEHIAPDRIGAHQVNAVCLVHAEQVNIGLDKTKQCVRIALDKKLHGSLLVSSDLKYQT